MIPGKITKKSYFEFVTGKKYFHGKLFTFRKRALKAGAGA